MESLMSFTDEDLKRLKEIHDESTYCFQIDEGDGSLGSDRWVTLAALIARLEAAEDIANCYCNHGHDCWELKLQDAWCKAKGEI